MVPRSTRLTPPTRSTTPTTDEHTPAATPPRRITLGGTSATPQAEPQHGWFRNPLARQAPPQRPGQPAARPAGPAAIPATVTLTVTVQTGPEDHRTPVKDAEVTVNDREPVKSGERGSVTLPNIATEGKPISVRVSHSGYIGTTRTFRPERMSVTETIVLRTRSKVGMGLVLGVIAILALIPIGVGMFISPTSAPLVIAIQPPAMPEIKPLDLANAAWIGPVQGMLLFLGVLLIGLGLMDRWLVKQLHDITVPLICVLALYVLGWAPIRAFLAAPPFTFTDQRTIGWLVIVASLVAVFAVSRLPTPDYTASGLYSGLLVVAGVTIGSLGLMQVAFGIPNAPVVSMGQTFALVQQKAWTSVQFSVLIYALCMLAIGFYGWESVKPNQEGSKPSWGGPVLAVLGLVVYYAASRGMIRAGFITDPDWAWLYYAMALLMTLIGNWIGAALANQVLTGDTVAMSHSYTDVRLGFLTVRTPWDVISLEIMMGILLILMFGTI